MTRTLWTLLALGMTTGCAPQTQMLDDRQSGATQRSLGCDRFQVPVGAGR